MVVDVVDAFVVGECAVVVVAVAAVGTVVVALETSH
jgi:hypothetical protein